MSITAAIVIALLVGTAIGLAMAYLKQQSRTRKLKQRFGPEYSRAVAQTGDRHAAEASLESCQRRVWQMQLRPLSDSERARFQENWREVQARFVDDPANSLTEADLLIGEVMSAEGYPLLEFEQRADDISVDHPLVVENYREGHEIALRNVQRRVSTEELRKAMLNYRTLFEELVGQPEYAQLERTGP
ncbi:MAG: hypothetical protein WBL50_21445 [Candidatus Acidiferrum sp.]